MKNQNVLVKLREEIEGIVGVGPESRLPDRTDLKKMIYLTYVLKEGQTQNQYITYIERTNELTFHSPKIIPIRTDQQPRMYKNHNLTNRRRKRGYLSYLSQKRSTGGLLPVCNASSSRLIRQRCK